MSVLHDRAGQGMDRGLLVAAIQHACCCLLPVSRCTVGRASVYQLVTRCFSADILGCAIHPGYLVIELLPDVIPAMFVW